MQTIVKDTYSFQSPWLNEQSAIEQRCNGDESKLTLI